MLRLMRVESNEREIEEGGFCGSERREERWEGTRIGVWCVDHGMRD